MYLIKTKANIRSEEEEAFELKEQHREKSRMRKLEKARTLPTDELQLLIKSAGGRKDKFDVKKPPQQYQNRTIIQVGLENENYLNELHERLNDVCNQVRVKNRPPGEKESTVKVTWEIPFMIIAFVANEIKGITESKIKEWKYTPWVKFKKLLWDIYDHRLHYSEEINGAANSNYVCLIEYLMIFFMETLLDRSAAEEAIVDLFVNLRYYYEKWPRAKSFSWNLEVIKFAYENEKIQAQETDGFGDKRREIMPLGIKRDDKAAENDIYSQEFFLWAYSIMTSSKKHF